jgi:uncharacterized protein YjiS (DUF1127 family)
MIPPRSPFATSPTAPSPRLAPRPHGLALHTLLARLWAAVSAWQYRRRSQRDLLSLDDRMLKDIGLTRAQAEAASRKPFWRH